MRYLTVGLAWVLATTSIAHAQQRENIVVGQPNWFAGELVGSILATIIEDRFGIPTQVVAGTNGEIFDEMVAPNGAIDIHPDVWLPNQGGWVYPALQAGTIALSSNSYEGVDALCVPQYVSDEYGINTVADLVGPNGREIFDVTGDGRGDVWIGAQGWGSTEVMQVKMRDYGLQEYLDPLLLSEGDFQDILFERQANRQPIAFYCYQPHVWFALDYITVLEEAPYDPANYIKVSSAESDNWLAESRVETGDIIKDVQLGYATRLQNSHPEIVNFLSEFGLSGDELTELIFLIQVKDIGINYVVDDWIAMNSERIDDWIAAD